VGEGDRDLPGSRHLPPVWQGDNIQDRSPAKPHPFEKDPLRL